MRELIRGKVPVEQKDLLGGNYSKILVKDGLACIWMVAVEIESVSDLSEL